MTFIRPATEGPFMHDSCYQWVGAVVDAHDLADRTTVELGSMNVNGTVRDHFTGSYLGVDMAEGPGVDLVSDAETMEGVPQNQWDNVVSTEMLEHVARPWLVMRRMALLGRPGSHFILTARGYDERGAWEPHAYPFDYWRFSELSMRTLAEEGRLDVVELLADPEGPGWFLHGVLR